MKAPLPKKYLVWAIAVVLGVTLIRSSLFHVENNYAFLLSIYSYQIVDSKTGMFIAGFVPYLQLTIGLILLLFPRLWLAAFQFATILFLGYTTLQIITYFRGLDISCGCFSPTAASPIGLASIGLAAACALAGLVGCILSNSSISSFSDSNKALE
ncbi:MauE/DoxX family redox-associated membrane protein [Gimesia aquarii]|uniref:Methylamine utilisation protein MauE domain-containing protein n=1 Tax=Gimesia aquarii TaxID=2527964 RepID=A0A517W003_9PLAN|nr:MauE/DoxX family redox-associated membrane protein [Gimesia aquarii]QDT98560.1 hypothetical protein V144x_40670 [Gimesia aquarii]